MSKCACCFGTGWVLDANGERRPCSRCRADDFSEWAKHRAQLREAGVMLVIFALTFPIFFELAHWLRG